MPPTPPTEPPNTTTPPARRRRPAVVSVELRPHESQWDALWDMYATAFEPLQELALLNHLYARDEFEELLDDERVIKIIARSEGEPVGMAMVTSELSIVPQISPPFLHKRYPDEAARSAVFFGIMVFVDEAYMRSSVFPRLVAGMGQVTAEQSGIIVFDICRHNMETFQLEEQIKSIAFWFPGATFELIDQQSYFGASLPALPDRRLPISPLPAEREQPSRPDLVAPADARDIDRTTARS